MLGKLLLWWCAILVRCRSLTV